MSLSRRLRAIALTQINAIRDRLDRIDAEAAAEADVRHAQRDARREFERDMREGAARQPTRTPEEIAAGKPGAPPASPQPDPVAAVGPLAQHYRVLGLDEGADLSEVEAKYRRLAARCAPERFDEGSEEQRTARDILARVEVAYNELRDALDPTAGRFDKLEL